MVQPFQTLIDVQPPDGLQLGEPLRAVYGPWPLPEAKERPFVYANFVMSLDGRVSFNMPGRAGGGDVSRHDRHDRWLMGLLRARADGILIGGSSIDAAGKHTWTPEAVAPDDGALWEALRSDEGRVPVPLLIVLTRSGNVPATSYALDNRRQPVLIATTAAGAERARGILGERDWVNYLISGRRLDNAAVMVALRADYKLRHVLVEGGPQILAALADDRQLDDLFVTVSPILIGASHEQHRPSLVQGIAFGHEQPPRMRLLSLHRNGDYLYTHYRIHE